MSSGSSESNAKSASLTYYTPHGYQASQPFKDEPFDTLKDCVYIEEGKERPPIRS